MLGRLVSVEELRRRLRNSGFTLIELLVVIAIIGIAGAVLHDAAQLPQPAIVGRRGPQFMKRCLDGLADAPFFKKT